MATLIRDDFATNVKNVRSADWDLEGWILVMELRQDVVWHKQPIQGPRDRRCHWHSARPQAAIPPTHTGKSMKWQRRGYHVILIGGMNVARSRLDGHPNLRTSPPQHVKNRYDFNQKFFDSEEGFRGVDVFRHLHGEKRKYTHHPRGHAWVPAVIEST